MSGTAVAIVFFSHCVFLWIMSFSADLWIDYECCIYVQIFGCKYDRQSIYAQCKFFFSITKNKYK